MAARPGRPLVPGARLTAPATARDGATGGDARSEIRDQALALGFDAAGFVAVSGLAGWGDDLAGWLAEGRQGDMGWMGETAARRASPRALWPEARGAVVLATSYAPAGDPLALLRAPERGAVSVYARNRDYHDLIKTRLKRLAGWMAGRFGCAVKVFVDTAPVMEKPLAHLAGLGWRGRHGNLVSRRLGNWFFLSEILTTLDLEGEGRVDDHCGRCRACVAACPTGAIGPDGRVDPRRCVSYLTIEHKGHIPRSLRPGIGNRVYGCDDCLAVCPWNKFARPTRVPDFLPRAELTAPRLADLAALDDADFREVFAGSPIKRIGRDRFVRNVMIAIGNSRRAELCSALEPRLDDDSALVRAGAAWALHRLASAAAVRRWRKIRLEIEADPQVCREWNGPAVPAPAGDSVPDL